MAERYEYLQQNYDNNKIENLNDYIAFCSIETNRKTDSRSLSDLSEKQKAKDLKIYRKYWCEEKYLKTKIRDLPIMFIRDENIKEKELISGKLLSHCMSHSGITADKSWFKLTETIQVLGSYAISSEFQLETPYYSADDDKYNIFDNPVLKDKVFKVPMMRGSSWKGVIASAAKSVMEKTPCDKRLERLFSFVRLFGSGSEEFRNLIDAEKLINPTDPEFKKRLLLYALNNLGKEVKLDEKDYLQKIWEKISKEQLQVQRGRLVFYPTFFNKLGIEMINPHKRKTKAGTNPIYYEVVPAGATGQFQIVYIPADNVNGSEFERRKEFVQDLQLLQESLRLIFTDVEEHRRVNIGAKTKLGWGRISFRDKKMSFASAGVCSPELDEELFDSKDILKGGKE